MELNDIVKASKSLSLFSGVDDDFLKKAVADKTLWVKEVLCGEKFEITSCLALLLSGRADIVKEIGGRATYLKTIKEGSVSGLATLFQGEREYISTILAKTNLVFLIFEERLIRELLEEDKTFASKLTLLLCEKLRYLNQRIDCYTSPSAEDKLREYLHRSSNCKGEVELSMSKLSKTLDIGRASLYRALNSLLEKGEIKKEPKKIILIK